MHFWARDKKIIRMRKDGQPYRKIAAEIGLSKDRIRKIVAQAERIVRSRVKEFYRP